MRVLCHRMLLLIALLGMTIAGPVGRCAWTDANTPNKARSTWMKGYQKIVEADKAEAAESQALALQLYTEALNIFREVNKEFPNWNSEVVQFRINYCEERIRRLELTVDVKRSEKSKADLITELQEMEETYATLENSLQTKKNAAQDRLAGANSQIEKLKTQIQALEQEKAEFSDHAEEIIFLKKSAKELNAQNTELSEKLGSAEGLLQKQKQKNKELEEHRKSLLDKQSELEDANEELEENVASAEKQAAKLEEELAQHRADNRELRDLREETQVLKSTLADRTHQLDIQKRLKLELMAEAKQADKTSAQLAEKEEALKQAQQEIKELQASVHELEHGRIRALEKKNQALIADLEGKGAEQQDLKNRLALKDKKMITELQEMEETYATLENSLQTKKNAAQGRLAEANSQIEKLKTQIQALEQEMAEFSDHAEEIIFLKKSAKELNAQNTELSEKLGSAEELLQKQKQKNKELEEHRKSLLDKQSELEDANEELEENVASAEKQAAKIEEELAQHRADNRELRGLREETQVLKSTLADRTQQLDIQKRLNLELMAEAKQAGKTSAQLAEKEEALKQAQQEIKELQASVHELEYGRIRALEKKNQALISDLEGKGAEQQDLKNRLALKDKKISELQALLEKSGVKEMEKLEQQLAAQKGKIAAAEKEIAALRKNVLAKEESEKRLIAEKKKRLAEEQSLSRKKREREEKLHSLLKTASSTEADKDMEKAIWYYEKVLEMEPRHRDALTRLGFLFAERGQDVEAERYLLRAFELQPNNTDILLRLGRCQLKQAKIPMAIASLSRGTALGPKNPDFRHLYGIACRSMGWAAAAETQFRECLKLDKGNKDAAFNLAVLLATLDDPRMEEARKWYEKAKGLGVKPNAQLEAIFENR